MGNDNITLRQNIHTDGQMFLAPTNSCYPEGPTFHANANVVVDHSEFTDWNETNGGQEGRLTVCGAQRTSGGFKITNNWFHGGWAGSAAASSVRTASYGYGDPYGVLIEGNEFSEMHQGDCVTVCSPGPVPTSICRAQPASAIPDTRGELVP